MVDFSCHAYEKMIQWIIFELKATEGIRTPDLLITNQLLYRLSHGSNTRTKIIIYMEQKFCKCFYTFSELPEFQDS